MQLGSHQTSERLKTDITDSSGKQLGSISQNPEKRLLEISLTDVGDSREAGAKLRELADILESDSSKADSGGKEAPADATEEGEASTGASADTRADAEASADASAEAEATEEREASTGASADTRADAEASSEAGTEAEATKEGEASTGASGDATADTEASAQISSLEDLGNWVADKQTNDASPTPGRSIREVCVESWLQVPEILRALHNDEGPLRITYLAQENSTITAEQTAISEFLIANAGNNLAGMLTDLEDKIENCHMVSSEQVSNEVAKEYLQSFSGAISAESSPLLTVAEVVRLDDSFKPLANGKPSFARNKIAAREQILATSTDTMATTGEYHTCIIEVPTDYVDIAKMFINEKWNAIPEDSRPPIKHTKVWVADDFVSGAGITEYDFEQFLRDAKDIPARRQKKKKEEESPTTPGEIILS